MKERRSFVGHIRDKFKDELTLFSMETAGYLGLKEYIKIRGLSRSIKDTYMKENDKVFIQMIQSTIDQYR